MTSAEKIIGYHTLTDEQIARVNDLKNVETDIAAEWRALAEQSQIPIDRRWMAIAKWQLQEGFSAMVRAITQPDDPFEG